MSMTGGGLRSIEDDGRVPRAGGNDSTLAVRWISASLPRSALLRHVADLDFTLWAIPGSILLIAVSIRVSGMQKDVKE